MAKLTSAEISALHDKVVNALHNKLVNTFTFETLLKENLKNKGDLNDVFTLIREIRNLNNTKGKQLNRRRELLVKDENKYNEELHNILNKLRKYYPIPYTIYNGLVTIEEDKIINKYVKNALDSYNKDIKQDLILLNINKNIDINSIVESLVDKYVKK